MAMITLKGDPFLTNGELPAVGDQSPHFDLVNNQLEQITLANFEGKRKLLNIVPSLDTPVCAESAREFNRSAGGADNVSVLVISADLPFAQGRFCETDGVNNVTALSMMRDKEFAEQYGVLITNGPLKGLCARAVVVLDEQNRVVYTELVQEITREPNYEAAIAALHQ